MKHLTAIDIGTGMVKILVGQKEENSSEIKILAKEKIPQFGLRKGEIYDLEKVAEGLINLKEKLQKEENLKIKKVIVNINGPHISLLKSQGLISISRADGRISEEDIQRALQAGQIVTLPSNNEILDVLVQEFIIDGEGGIKEPLGLRGFRLEVKLFLISVFSPILENLEKVIEKAGLELEEIIPSPLAVARAVLNSEQKELGIAVIDLGHSTTSLTVFNEGGLIDFKIFPFGSANITNDIAIGLRTEVAVAEQIKKEFGVFEISEKKKKTKKERINILEQELSFSKDFLKKIIRARVTEMFSEVAKELKKITKDTILPAGLILTGGGAFLAGLKEFAKDKFELPCRLAGPRGILGLEEELDFSTVTGLLLSGFDNLEKELKEEKRGKGGLKTKLKKLIRIFSPD